MSISLASEQPAELRPLVPDLARSRVRRARRIRVRDRRSGNDPRWQFLPGTEPMAFAGATAAGASSIGLMSAVNAAIDSDFKWLPLGFAAVWASSLVSYLIEAQTPRSSTQSNQEHNHETP
jgi:hypothetical protein